MTLSIVNKKGSIFNDRTSIYINGRIGKSVHFWPLIIDPISGESGRLCPYGRSYRQCDKKCNDFFHAKTE